MPPFFLPRVILEVLHQESHRHIKENTKKSPIHWFTHQMLPTAGPVPGQS